MINCTNDQCRFHQECENYTTRREIDHNTPALSHHEPTKKGDLWQCGFFISNNARIKNLGATQ